MLLLCGIGAKRQGCYKQLPVLVVERPTQAERDEVRDQATIYLGKPAESFFWPLAVRDARERARAKARSTGLVTARRPRRAWPRASRLAWGPVNALRSKGPTLRRLRPRATRIEGGRRHASRSATRASARSSLPTVGVASMRAMLNRVRSAEARATSLASNAARSST